MIAFVSTVEKLSLLSEEQRQAAYEVISNISDINKLVSSLKNAYHYTQIIIDISIFDNDESEIIKALYQLKSMNSTKIIIIAQGKCAGDTFLNELVKMGIYDFILSWISETAQLEMYDCIKGREYQDVSNFVLVEDTQNQKKNFFKSKPHKKSEPIIIQVVGVYPRIGTTTQAIRIAKSLVSSGYKACYVEKNQSGHLSILKDVLSQARSINENTTIYLDIHLCQDINDDVLNSYEYIICDYGNFSDFPINTLVATYKTIIVAGSAAWEIFNLPPLIELTNSFADVKYVFSFTGKKDEEDILEFMQDNWTKTFFAEYSPDMLSELSEIEKQMYSKLILSSKKTGL